MISNINNNINNINNNNKVQNNSEKKYIFNVDFLKNPNNHPQQLTEISSVPKFDSLISGLFKDDSVKSLFGNNGNNLLNLQQQQSFQQIGIPSLQGNNNDLFSLLQNDDFLKEGVILDQGDQQDFELLSFQDLYNNNYQSNHVVDFQFPSSSHQYQFQCSQQQQLPSLQIQTPQQSLAGGYQAYQYQQQSYQQQYQNQIQQQQQQQSWNQLNYQQQMKIKVKQEELQEKESEIQIFEMEEFQLLDVKEEPSTEESLNNQKKINSGNQQQQQHQQQQQEVQSQVQTFGHLKNQNIFQITQNVLQYKKIKKQNSEKNICRYITRQCIRSFIDKIFEEKVLEICDQDKNLYENSKSLMKCNLEMITGQRALTEFFETESSAEKEVFKTFMEWFLRERYVRYILSGNMANKKQYIRYKNQVMLKFLAKKKVTKTKKQVKNNNNSNDNNSN